jgi:hypothetical protein
MRQLGTWATWVAATALAGCVDGGSSPRPGNASPSPGAVTATSHCPEARARFELKGVPYPVENFQGPTLEVDGKKFGSCTVAGLRVSVAAQAPDLGAVGNDWSLYFDHPGSGPINFRLIEMPRTKPLRGKRLGSRCGSLVFSATGPPFLPDGLNPPYDGMFRASGSPGFADYRGRLAAGSYKLYPTSIKGPLTITCFVIDMDLR